MPLPTQTENERAIREVALALESVAPERLDEVAKLLVRSKVVVGYAGGREGLAIRGMIMRLFHAGLDTHMVADMSCPPVGPGDLLVLSCGPGNISTVIALAGVAKRDGAEVLLFTAEPTAPPADVADEVVVISAQTMANDVGSEAVLPMGSTFEVVLFMLADLVTNRVRALRGETPNQVRARHTNLE